MLECYTKPSIEQIKNIWRKIAMGERDEKMIRVLGKKYNLSSDDIMKALKSLAEDGFIGLRLDNYHITKKGIKRCDEAIKKGEKGI